MHMMLLSVFLSEYHPDFLSKWGGRQISLGFKAPPQILLKGTLLSEVGLPLLLYLKNMEH